MTAQPETLSDYLARRKAQQEKPRKPVWIQRMQQGKLPNKDMTGRGPDAA